MVSKMAILLGLETKWDNDTVNGIKNGYYQSTGSRTRRKVAKSLNNLHMAKGEPGQWTGDQVARGL